MSHSKMERPTAANRVGDGAENGSPSSPDDCASNTRKQMTARTRR